MEGLATKTRKTLRPLSAADLRLAVGGDMDAVISDGLPPTSLLPPSRDRRELLAIACLS
jgi:hypothetical protein